MNLARRLSKACPAWIGFTIWAWGLAQGLSAQTNASGDGKTGRLAERYRAMLHANPAEGMALDRLWKLHEDAGTTGELLQSYRQAAEATSPDNSDLLVYGYLLKKTGRLDEAAQIDAQVAKRDADNPTVHMALAELATARGKPEDAANEYGLALVHLPEKDRRQAEVLLKQGEAWLAAGKPARASGVWEQAAAARPQDFALRRRIAETCEKDGRLEEAAGQYRQIAEQGSPAERTAAWRDLGRLYAALGRFDPARDALEQGLALVARDNWLHDDLQARLIRLYQQADRAGELQARWRAAAEGSPRDLGAFLRLAALAEAQGDTRSQREALEKIVALNPRDRESTRKLAAVLAETGERARAAELYDTLLLQQPDNLGLLLARADLDVQLGRADAAVRRIEARVAESPADESVSAAALEFFVSHRLDEPAERLLRAGVARAPAATEPTLALAKFLFAHRRPADARAALGALVAAPGDTAERIARLTRVAQIYQDANASEDALRCWRAVAALEPQQPAPLLAQADLLRAAGDISGAVQALERAVALDAPDDERLATDKKLFDTLRAEDSGSEPPSAAELAKPNLRPPSSVLPQRLAQLADLARENHQATDYVRLARWHGWAGDTTGSLAAAREAIALDPENREALDLAAGAASALHQPDLAESFLSERIRLDPGHADATTRRLAQLKLANGQTQDALALFTQLESRSPGARDVLLDLAQAQQRADLWFDAIQTWQRAAEIPGGTPTQRAEVRRALVAAYEHVGQFTQALLTLAQAMEAQTELVAKFDLLEQAASLARQHGLEKQLADHIENLLRRQPDDYFALAASAKLKKDTGEAEQGYALLRRAHYVAPDQARSLEALVREGDELGRIDEAIDDQRRLLALPGQRTVENLACLADLLAENQSPQEATQVWEDVAARFPRDPVALTKAADFFERVDQGPRARELMRAAVALDTTDLRLWLRLGELDARAGDVDRAIANFEKILSLTEPERPGQPVAPPEELRVSVIPFAAVPGSAPGFRLRTFGGRPGSPVKAAFEETNDAALRLEAITEESRLFSTSAVKQNPRLEAERARWLDRWQREAVAGKANEPLAAFYFAGDASRTLQLLGAALENGNPDGEALAGAYVLAGLRLGAYEPVGQWVWSGGSSTLPSRLQALAAGMERYLGTGGKPEPGLVAGVFPANVNRPDVLWDAARELAGLYWYTAAAELGERVLARKTGERAACAVDVAEWELYAGQKEKALGALRTVLDDPGANTLDSNVNSLPTALRQYYLLLNPDQRVGFVADYLQKLRARGETAPALLAGVLLHGLAGDEGTARREADALLAKRALSDDLAGPSANAQRWAFLLSNGVQLQIWGLESLAADLWRRALQEGNALDRRTGETAGTLAEIQRRLVGVQVGLAGNPEAARECVADYLAASPPTSTAASVGGELLNNSRYTAGIQVFEYLCRVEPHDAEHWLSLFSADEAAGESDRLERTLAGLFDSGAPLPEGLPRADFVCRWAAVRERNGDPEGACQVLEAEQKDPASVAMLIQLAHTYERRHLFDRAAAIWQEIGKLTPGAAATLGLANAQEEGGHRDQAIQTLRGGWDGGQEAGRSETAARLARLYLAAKQPGTAHELAETLLREGRLESFRDIAAAFVSAGQKPLAVELLAAAVQRAKEPESKYGLQQALVGLIPASGPDRRRFVRQLARLETFARSVPALQNSLPAAKYKLERAAGADDLLEAELRQRWQEGKGDYLAGERLATLHLETKRTDLLAQVIGQFDHRPMLPDQLLFGLEKALAQAGQAGLALPIAERLCRRFPQNVDFALGRAAVLWKSGQRDEANRVIDALANTAVITNDVSEKIALLYLELGDDNRARDFFVKVVQNDSAATQSPGSFLELARLELVSGKAQQAEKLLRTAYRQDAVTDFGPLVDFLAKTGQLEGKNAAMMPVPDFPLSFRRRAALLGAVSERLSRDGRAAAGRELLLNHPAFLAEIPAAALVLYRNSTPPECERLSTAVQVALDQAQPPYPRLRRLQALMDEEATAKATAASVPGEETNRDRVAN